MFDVHETRGKGIIGQCSTFLPPRRPTNQPFIDNGHTYGTFELGEGPNYEFGPYDNYTWQKTLFCAIMRRNINIFMTEPKPRENLGTPPESERNSAPEGAPATPDSIVKNATRKLQDLRSLVERKTGEAKDALKIEEKVRDISKAIDATGTVIGNASIDAQNKFNEEVARFPQTIKDLPENAKNQGINLYSRMKNMTKRSYKVVADGVGNMFGKVAEFGGNVSDFLKEITAGMRPHMGKLLSLPFLKFLIDEKYIKMAQNFLGYDEEAEQIAEEIRNRLPEGGTLNITSKAEKTTFKDLYDTMLSRQNRSPASYPRGVFVKEVIAIMIKDDVAKANTEVNMTQFATAAKKLIEETPKAAVPATPVAPTSATPPAAPPAAPTPSAPAAGSGPTSSTPTPPAA